MSNKNLGYYNLPPLMEFRPRNSKTRKFPLTKKKIKHILYHLAITP
jgi:hypothetical protein